MNKKQIWKKVENLRFCGQNKLLLSTLPFNPWAVSATWLYVGAPHKNTGKLS
jgi:hypothetical protein